MEPIFFIPRPPLPHEARPPRIAKPSEGRLAPRFITTSASPCPLNPSRRAGYGSEPGREHADSILSAVLAAHGYALHDALPKGAGGLQQVSNFTFLHAAALSSAAPPSVPPPLLSAGLRQAKVALPLLEIPARYAAVCGGEPSGARGEREVGGLLVRLAEAPAGDDAIRSLTVVGAPPAARARPELDAGRARPALDAAAWPLTRRRPARAALELARRSLLRPGNLPPMDEAVVRSRNAVGPADPPRRCPRARPLALQPAPRAPGAERRAGESSSLPAR